MRWVRSTAQVIRRLIDPTGVALEASLRGFDTAPRPIDQVISEMMSTGLNARVSRQDALSIAAVRRGRDEICSIGTLPLRLYRGSEIVPSPLLAQINPNVPNVITLAQTLEDLLFEGIAWWRVLATDFDRYPIFAEHVDVGRVSLQPPTKPGGQQPNTSADGAVLAPDAGPWVYVDGNAVPASTMIRFDSPNPGLITTKGIARSIRVALLLDLLAMTYADNPRPLDYFTASDKPDIEPLPDDEVPGFLAEWRSMRKASGTAYIPENVQRVDVNAPSPAELQLVELKRQAWIEIANGIGVDPEDLGVSTTSRTYQNEDARRRDKISRMYAPYMLAITGRLSMGDVTRRGYEVRHDLTEYLRPDPAGRVAYYQGLRQVLNLRDEWIAQQEGIPMSAIDKTAAAAAPPATGGQHDARPPLRLVAGAGASFDAGVGAIVFDAGDFEAPRAAPRADAQARTITGLALPYGAITRKYGPPLKFAPGALEYDAGNVASVKHLYRHQVPVGVTTAVQDTKAGPVVTLSVLEGVDGSPEKIARDQLLYDAVNGLVDGLSVGVEFSFNPDDGDIEVAENGEVTVTRATWRETSSTPLPAFTGARVTRVAADLTGGNMDPCPHCGIRHVAGIACQTARAQLATLTLPGPQGPQSPQPVPQPAPTPAPQPPAPSSPPYTQPGLPAVPVPNPLAAFDQQTIGALVALLQAQGGQALTVNPHHGPAIVREPDPYRFDGGGNLLKGSHDFSSDIVTGWNPNGAQDKAARDRVDQWIEKAFSDDDLRKFAITPTNVAALNPNRQRPDLYVDQMEYDYPIWAAINKGPLQDVTPFVVPKYSSSSGLVADHTTGTEPTPGAMAVTTQTITPTPVSGKLEITREAFDQGGNPQMSGLLWRQMVRAYFEALEAYGVAQFVANAASITDLTITTAAVDSALDQALAAALIPLRYVRGGMRFRKAFTQIDLYTNLAKAKDSTGAPLYPAFGPMNRAGTAGDDFGVVHARGIDFVPAWATAATSINASSSYMFDPEGVGGWASNPQRLDIVWRVAWVDMGLFGYKAFALLDAAKARELVYDPV